MALPDLRVRIGADTGQLDRAIGATQGKLKDFARNVAITVGGALTIGLVRDTFRATAQLENLSKVAGVSVERFQELSIGVRQFGVDQDKLADILKDVNDKFGDFAQTGAGPLADFFEKIAPQVGLTAEAFADLSSEQKLGAYIDALQRANVSQADMTFYMEAIANDATLLVTAFENSGAAMQGMIDRARELGLVLDEEMIKKGKEANDQLTLLEQVLSGNLSRALINIAPLIGGLSEYLVTLTTNIRSFVNDPGLIKFLEVLNSAYETLDDLQSREIANTIRNFDMTLPVGFELRPDFVDRMQSAIDRAGQEINWDNLPGFTPVGPDGFPVIAPPMRPEGLTKPLQDTAAAARTVSSALRDVGDNAANVQTSLNRIGMAAKSAFVNFVTGASTAKQALSQLAASMAAMFAERAFMSLFGGFSFFRAPSFAGGGYTGSGPRSGGMDGRGGFPAILHPNETVIDHTRGGAAGMVRVIVEEAPGFATRVRTEAQGVAVQVVQAGIQQYDRLVAPATQRRVAADPRRVG